MEVMRSDSGYTVKVKPSSFLMDWMWSVQKKERSKMRS